MNKSVTTLIGYSENDSCLEYGESKVIAEIETGGSDSNGFKNSEVIGLAQDRYDSFCLYRGSKDSNLSEKHMVIYFSDDDKDIPDLLRKLAEVIENG